MERTEPNEAGAAARLIRHELNNPLTGILGNAELILTEDAALAEKTRRRLKTIIELAVRLRDVLRELEERLGGSEDPPTLTRPCGVSRAAPATRAPL